MQSLFTCEPASIDAQEAFVDWQCTRTLNVPATSLTLDHRTKTDIGFLLNVGKLSRFNQRLEFNYEISFNPPAESDETTPRPTLTGKQFVHPPALNTSVFTDLRITTGISAPVQLPGSTSIDVSQHLTVTGTLIDKALNYQLEIHCAGSSLDRPYLAEEQLLYTAPGINSLGTPIPPMFTFDLSLLGGRRCDFSLSATLVSEAGIIEGVSRIRFYNVELTGGVGGTGGPPAVASNELELTLGSGVCISEDQRPVLSPSGICQSEEALLFTLSALTPNEQEQSRPITASHVASADVFDHNKRLSTGLMPNGGSFKTDIILADIATKTPTCGITTTLGEQGEDVLLTGPLQLNTCPPEQATYTLLQRTEDRLHLTENLTLVTLEGDHLNDDGSIPLTTVGLNDYIIFEPKVPKEVLRVSVDIFANPEDPTTIGPVQLLISAPGKANPYTKKTNRPIPTMDINAPGRR